MQEATANKPDLPILAEIIRRIVAAIAPERIILFGSRARGDVRPDSDYDLLVIKHSAERTLKLEQRAYAALVGVPVPVDVVVETPERLEEVQDTPGFIFGRALREGQVIYVRS